MEFSEDGYTIRLNDPEIELLRKEFLLLKFLYTNNGRTFSREELLDAIWPHEFPTDRTVDDHIYRLRKKLNSLQDDITIKTIKGLGYRLEVKERVDETPTSVPKEIEKQANELFDTYYKYGQGKALRELLTNKVLGLALNEKQETVLLWLNSDFKALLKRLADTKNAIVPLLLYGFVESDTEKVIDAHKRVLDEGRLDEKERMDISCFSLSLWYMKFGRPETSLQLVQQEIDGIRDIHHGFFPFLNVMKSAILFYQNKLDEAKRSIENTEILLRQLPYLRETSALRVLQGLLLIRDGDEKAGREKIEEGRGLIRQSGHTYYLLFIYQLLKLLLPNSGASKETIQFYDQAAERYMEETELEQLKPKIESQLISLI
mgnify:CR=1 FL=1